jgi:hypothetical protein
MANRKPDAKTGDRKRKRDDQLQPGHALSVTGANTQLVTTQADLTKAQADLSKANTRIQALEGDLKAARTANTGLKDANLQVQKRADFAEKTANKAGTTWAVRWCRVGGGCRHSPGEVGAYGPRAWPQNVGCDLGLSALPV